MAYDVFSQLQGPQIDVNLFPNSASAGIRAGNSLPSPLSAGITGAIEGIQTGQKIYDQYQNSQIKQNQIEQQPVANQRAQIELENEQAIATINKNRAQVDELTQATNLKIAQQKSENELAATQKAHEDTTNDETAFAALSNPDPNVQASVVKDQNLFSHVLQNPKLLEQATGILQNNPEVSSQQKQQLIDAQGYYKEQDLKLKQQAALQKTNSSLIKNFDKIAENVNSDGQLLAARAAAGGLTPVEFASKVETRAIDNLGTGTQRYDVYVDGQKQNQSIDETSNKNLLQYQDALKAQGVISQRKPTLAPTSTPTPAPSRGLAGSIYDYFAGGDRVPAGTPTSNALLGSSPTTTPNPNIPEPTRVQPPTDTSQIDVNSKNPIVQQRANDLANRAKNDPDLRNRLVAKGMLQTTPTATPIPSPTDTPPVSPEPTPSANISPTQTTADAVTTPVPTPEPKSLKQNIDYTVKSLDYLPKAFRPNSEVMHTVLTEPLLSEQKPLYQAVAAVESGGLKKPKATGTTTAKGLFQLTSGTAKGLKVNPDVPEQNVIGGTKLLDSLLERYNDNEIPAVMAYYFGEPVINAAANIAGSYEYDGLSNALDYMKAHGYFPNILTSSKLSVGKQYPMKVLAYKKAFESVTNA